MTSEDEDRLADLLVQWEELILEGRTISPDDLCRECPELLSELRRRIAALEAMNSILPLIDGELPATHPFAENTAAVPVNDLPGYEILKELGHGGMGVVYMARNKDLNRIEAIKMVLAGAHATKQQLSRFRTEAEAVAQLTHDSIVRIYSIGTHEGLPFFAMEFVDGGSLAERIAGKPQGARESAELLSQLARAMDYAHLRGIIHRDLKPRNVLLTSAGVPKITDFGLAKQLKIESGQTMTGDVLGTPNYMAPEQASGKTKEVGAAADVYALGAILYEMLTGRPPFQDESSIVTLRKVVEEEPQAPSTLLPKVSRDLETICLKCLAKDPGQRYRTGEALAEELERWLRHEPIQARPATPPERAWKWAKRHPAVALLSVAVTVLFVAGFAGVAWQWRQAVAAKAVADAAADSERLAKIEERKAKETAQQQESEAIKQRRRAEAREYKMLLEAAEAALNERKLEVARRLVRDAAEDQRGWEADRIAYEASAQSYITMRLSDHSWGITHAVLSPDGKQLVSAGADGRLLVWDMSTGRVTKELTAGRWSDQHLMWMHLYSDRIATPSLTQLTEFHTHLCWLPGTSRVAAASVDGTCDIFDLSTGERQVLAITSEPLDAVACNSDGSHLLLGGEEGELHLVSVRTSQTITRDLHPELGAVTAVEWLGQRDEWIIGYANGQVRVLDGASLSEKTRIAVSPPVWCLSLVDDVEDKLVIVGYGRPEILVYQVGGVPTTLQRIDSLKLPRGQTPSHAVHAVRAVEQGRLVYAIDDTGDFVLWDRKAGGTNWIVPGVDLGSVSSDQFKPLARDQVEKITIRFVLQAARSLTGLFDTTTGSVMAGLRRLEGARYLARGLPLPFRRVASAIVPLPNDTRLLTAGEDKLIRVWQPAVGAETNRLSIAQGRARILFDRRDIKLLWHAGADGRLCVIDADSNTEVGSTATGSKRLRDLAAVGDSAVITAGDDGRLEFWRWADGEIRRARAPIEHAHGLLAAAASHAGDLVATVDDRAVLRVWKSENDELVFESQLAGTQAGAPLTGRVAFNADDSRLAAFGPGQSCRVFATRPFGLLPGQPALAGNGGLAMLWHPSDPDFLLVSDDAKRYNFWASPGCAIDYNNKLGSKTPNSSCVAMTSTPDGRRWFLLEEQGRLVVCDPIELGTVLERSTQSRPVCDIACDTSGRRLAVASADGTVDFWETTTRSAPPQEAVDVSEQWRISTLAELSGGLFSLLQRCVLLDQDDRLCLLLVKRVAATDPEGELFFVLAERDGAVVEPISQSSRVPTEAVSLRIGEDGGLVAVFRESTGEAGTYGADLKIAHRAGPNTWVTGDPIEQGNIGYYPATVLRDGKVTDVFHFTFGEYYWLRTSRTPNGWQTEIAGQQGDGTGLVSMQAREGDVHFMFGTKRFGRDTGPSIYASWDGDDLTREVLDPAGQGHGRIVLDRDGRPLALVRRAGPRGTSQFVLAHRPAGAWQYEHLPLDGVHDELHDFAVGRDGQVYILTGDPDRKNLLLWQGSAGQWRCNIVARDWPSGNAAVLRLDSRDRPFIVIGLQDGSANYRLSALRPRE